MWWVTIFLSKFGAATNKHFMLTVTETYGANEVQFADLQLWVGHNQVDMQAVLDATSDKSSPGNHEGPLQAFDGTSSTKWLTLNAGGPPMTLSFNFETAYAVDGISFVTANAMPTRDPKKFKLEGKAQMGDNWTTVIDMTSTVATQQQSRKTQTEIFPSRSNAAKCDSYSVTLSFGCTLVDNSNQVGCGGATCSMQDAHRCCKKGWSTVLPFDSHDEYEKLDGGCSGSDEVAPTAKTLKACRQACDAKASCNGFVFKRGEANPCKLKQISGCANTVQLGWTFYGKREKCQASGANLCTGALQVNSDTKQYYCKEHPCGNSDKSLCCEPAPTPAPKPNNETSGVVHVKACAAPVVVLAAWAVQ